MRTTAEQRALWRRARCWRPDDVLALLDDLDEALAEVARLRAVADAARDVAALCHAEHPALEHLRAALARLDGGP